MELASQLAGIEEEVTLLKGEIRSILKEIRAAVLNSDNPFTSNGGAGKAPAPPSQLIAEKEEPVAPEPATAGPSPFAPHPVETPQAASQLAPVPEPATLVEPAPLHAPAREQNQDTGTTSLFTIASLLAWAEDAMNTLGARRFRLMLELAYSAELLSPEIRDVLRDLAEIWSTEKEPDRPVNVNEVLLQLRQLEAIVNGERVTRIPRRRARRRGA